MTFFSNLNNSELITKVIISLLNFVAVVRFNEIDDDGDRQITFDELKKWHKTNRIVRSDEELREMIRSKDRNNDGMLNIAEFVTLLLTRSTIDQNEKLFKASNYSKQNVQMYFFFCVLKVLVKLLINFKNFHFFPLFFIEITKNEVERQEW